MKIFLKILNFLLQKFIFIYKNKTKQMQMTVNTYKQTIDQTLSNNDWYKDAYVHGHLQMQ